MTKEEAIEQIEKLKSYFEYMADSDESGAYLFDLDGQALDLALSALRPVSREQVRRGEWEKIGADYRGQGGIWKCTACGKTYPYKCDFCPNCGAPMTDKAVDMVMERLEALHSETKTD